MQLIFMIPPQTLYLSIIIFLIAYKTCYYHLNFVLTLIIIEARIIIFHIKSELDSVSDRIMMMFRVCGFKQVPTDLRCSLQEARGRVIQGIVSGGPGQARAGL